LRILPSLNVLVAVGKGIRAVKLCCNEILQLTGCQLTQVVLYNGDKMVTVVVPGLMVKIPFCPICIAVMHFIHT